MTQDNKRVKAKKGLPPKNTRENGIYKYIVFFVIAGILIGMGIMYFEDSITRIQESLSNSGRLAWAQVLMGGGISLAVSLIQAAVFRDHIKSNTNKFIAYAVIGGLIGGLVAGSVTTYEGYVVGGSLGAVAGFVSSYLQVQLMDESRSKTSKWKMFSSISWLIIFAIGWHIGWDNGNGEMALGAITIMISSGISLGLYLNYIEPEIEF